MASDPGLDIKVVSRVYQRLRKALFHLCELEGGKLKGEIELDEAYFGGRRKGRRGRGAAGKSVVFGLIEREGRVYTKVVESVPAGVPMNHINGTEGFWSYAKHILYNHRGVSKHHFPMYLKETEYRFNHRKENVFKTFPKIYFGCVSP